MHKRKTGIQIVGWLLVANMLAISAGCETTKNWLQGRKTAEPEEVILDAPNANQYLYELQNLAIGDANVQAEIVADAKAAATVTPSPSTRLRYATVLATDGHAGTDYGEARHILEQLLAQPEMMTSAEVALANIYLGAVNDRSSLESRFTRQQNSSNRAASSEEAASARRISTLEADNRRLRASLAEAEAKIEALSSIERDIREQSDNGTPQ